MNQHTRRRRAARLKSRAFREKEVARQIALRQRRQFDFTLQEAQALMHRADIQMEVERILRARDEACGMGR